LCIPNDKAPAVELLPFRGLGYLANDLSKDLRGSGGPLRLPTEKSTRLEFVTRAADGRAERPSENEHRCDHHNRDRQEPWNLYESHRSLDSDLLTHLADLTESPRVRRFGGSGHRPKGMVAATRKLSRLLLARQQSVEHNERSEGGAAISQSVGDRGRVDLRPVCRIKDESTGERLVACHSPGGGGARKLGTPEGTSREPIPEAVRLFVWQRDRGQCVKCGSPERLDIDHIIPVAAGGSSTQHPAPM
jgi:hypothetical protein